MAKAEVKYANNPRPIELVRLVLSENEARKLQAYCGVFDVVEYRRDNHEIYRIQDALDVALSHSS